MVSTTDARKAAREYTKIHTDDAEEAERLKADETYGTLAAARQELEVLQKNSDDHNDDVREAINEALDDMRDAMNQRAIQHLLGEVDDAE